MDQSLSALCNAIKKTIGQLKPHNSSLSFTLVIGKENQGLSTLLRQSSLQSVHLESESNVQIYNNKEGIFVELSEKWLNQSTQILQNTLKHLNRCHHTLKISGIILCVDINEFFYTDPQKINDSLKANIQLLRRFGLSLGYKTDLALLFTKMDCLAGFCEFYQNEHNNDLKKPLGFSLTNAMDREKNITQFKKQFTQLIERLDQQTISKIHPVRSSIKRILIREFPLQLATLELTIQLLIKHIPPSMFNIKALFFTSAEQGGTSQDRLNKKIKHEYALSIQDTFHQSVNYRPYFIDGAIIAFQQQTKRLIPDNIVPHKWKIALLSSVMSIALVWLGYHHIKSSNLLDEVSKELLQFESITNQQNNDSPAEFYLTQATKAVDNISTTSVLLPTIQQMKAKLRANTAHQVFTNFLPIALGELEQTIVNPQSTHADRYQALKIYLMLSDLNHYSRQAVTNWFSAHWRQRLSEDKLKKRMALLNHVLHDPMQPISINRQIVIDARNYLNALPASYLYYSLAKAHFSKEKKSINIEGFQLSRNQLPVYYTKEGFSETLKQLSLISQQLQKENWILARQDIANLYQIMQQAYCYDYVTWWQNFINRSQPLHIQDYKQAHQLTKTLVDSAAIPQLIQFIQEQTKPDFENNTHLFNNEIASQFAELNLLSESTLNDLSSNLKELKVFSNTLSAISDQGRTAFTLTKARFNGDTLSNPLSALYSRSQQLPLPVSSWTKQIADEFWYLLIKDSRAYINQQWQKLIYDFYQNRIADRFPFDKNHKLTVSISDFEYFFGNQGALNQYISNYLNPFLDMSQAQWKPKELNDYALPITADSLEGLIRANIISNMFFATGSNQSKIEFSLQKINLDPIVANLQLTIGDTELKDTQDTESFARFVWPQSDASLVLNSIEGDHYKLAETGPWAFFKILQKVNVLVDEKDSSSLQILFEVNGNSGRYILKTHNQINPFMPGILQGFKLPANIA